MSENGTYTTMVQTEDGRKYDLGRWQRVPGRCKSHADETSCSRCLVVNAWTERCEEVRRVG